MTTRQIAIVGGGPAGLMAAETLMGRGHGVTVYDSMPSVGRKFLLAGKSGLNLTHSEDEARFAARFGAAGERLGLGGFPPQAVRDWAQGLGSPTFTGTSGRVFPVAMKASPLLRAWLARLTEGGVAIRPRHRWTGFDGAALRFETRDGERLVEADAVLLALGGGSWPRLGSDGAFAGILPAEGIEVAPLRPANCGFDVAWSPLMAERFAGAPVKSVVARFGETALQGEFVVSATGIEGSLVYAHAAALRDALEARGKAELLLDLAPGRTREALAKALSRQKAGTSLANRLRKGAGLSGVKAALLREFPGSQDLRDPQALAAHIKALPLPVAAPRPIAEAISSAGGVRLGAIDARFMARARPGLFLAGEMLDWEAPTGGYLLTACFATGRAAALGLLEWLESRPR
ncbi:TIGR03862 family flavoprotein [Aurantimonas sp. Leaf443]|uniref:TIGR03862 family flavoprotein n=1 Tax=Aurantimonas sp. Leaf443 TaxID=1736378 RepID=UPI0006FE7B7B|nr:TIGR03862 family flavoprotein [Aurantimonas sp. Leaf443]KQT85280.1 NAD(FAD)-utilizing dehydrogenase [Aurantimonas sp. Leaf443]